MVALLTVILMQLATKVTLNNTQHPKVVKNIFHWLVGRARAVARFGGVTPQCL